MKILSPRKTRSMSKEQSPSRRVARTKSNASKVNENKKKIAEKSSSAKNAASKPNLKNLSQKTSTITSTAADDGDKKMEKLEVLTSPRRLRSRSRSADVQPADTKKSSPNLKNLSRKREANKKAATAVEAKKSKVEVAAATITRRGTKRTANTSASKEVKSKKPKKLKDDDDDNDDDDYKSSGNESDDSSLKLFQRVKKGAKPKASSSKSSKKAQPSKSDSIDRRILSSEDEATVNMESGSPKKSKGTDIWVEVYSEKDEKWISIDVFRGKVDCTKDIIKHASHPLVYVFAWNNDSSVKDVSARYCANLNTTVRKMRVEANYLNSVLNMFAGVRTSRDLKEDNELNQLQLAKPMPTTVSE
jgi:xeroderma pigmentosum group C-complementing protein